MRADRKRNGSRLSLSEKQNLKGWIFVSPFVLGFLFIYLGIVVNSMQFSCSTVKLLKSSYTLVWVGFKNFREALFVNPDFNRLLFNSVSGLFTSLITIVIFSLFVAVILNQKMWGRAAFRAIFFIPVILATGFIEKASLNDIMTSNMSGGVIDTGGQLAGGLLSAADITVYLQQLSFSTQMISFIVSLVKSITNIINQSGVQILIFLAGLQSISPSIYESAQIEGATGWELFWKITFPMISPMILVNSVYTVIDYFTRSTSDIMELISDTAFEQAKYGLSSAMSWIYFAVIAVFVAVVFGVLYRFTFYQQKD